MCVAVIQLFEELTTWFINLFRVAAHAHAHAICNYCNKIEAFLRISSHNNKWYFRLIELHLLFAIAPKLNVCPASTNKTAGKL